MEKTVGLFFGSFNPIHFGHLIIASHMAAYGGVDKIWFVVTPENPLKEKSSLLHRFDRLDMVNLAIDDDHRFESCDIEFFLPQPSYTIHSLTALREKHPTIEFRLIMGSDNLTGLAKWKNYQKILDTTTILVYPRPGYDGGVFSYHPRVIHVDAPMIQVSSSFIRKCIRNSIDYRYLLPLAVKKFIEKKGFYL